MSDLGELTDRVAQVSDIYAARFGIERDALWRLAKLTEEVGELNAAYLNATGRGRDRGDGADPRQAVEDEAADVLAMLLIFARAEGIDLEAALIRKWFKHLQST